MIQQQTCKQLDSDIQERIYNKVLCKNAALTRHPIQLQVRYQVRQGVHDQVIPLLFDRLIEEINDATDR